MRIRSILTFFGLLELGSLIALGVFAGFWPTLAAVFGTFVVGFNLLRLPGFRISGVLFMIPGLITDVLALVFLLPAPRRWAGRVLQALFLRGVPTGAFQRVVFTTTQAGPMPGADGMPPPGWMPPAGGAASGGVVQAEVLDVKASENEKLPAE